MALCAMLMDRAAALNMVTTLPALRLSSRPRAAVRLEEGDGAVKIKIKAPSNADEGAVSSAAGASESGAKVTIKVKSPSEKAKAVTAPTDPVEAVDLSDIKIVRPNVTTVKPAAAPSAPVVTRSSEEEQLLKATQSANVTKILAALQTGVNPNFRDPKGRTPLHFMAGVGLAPACVLLIHFGAQVDARDEGGLTPMHMAAGYANAQSLRVLIQGGADFKAEAPGQGTPFDVCVALGEYQYKQWMEKKKKPFEKKDEKLEKLKACVDVLESAEEIQSEVNWEEQVEEVLQLVAL